MKKKKKNPDFRNNLHVQIQVERGIGRHTKNTANHQRKKKKEGCILRENKENETLLHGLYEIGINQNHMTTITNQMIKKGRTNFVQVSRFRSGKLKIDHGRL